MTIYSDIHSAYLTSNTNISLLDNTNLYNWIFQYMNNLKKEDKEQFIADYNNMVMTMILTKLPKESRESKESNQIYDLQNFEIEHNKYYNRTIQDMIIFTSIFNEIKLEVHS